MKKGVSLVKRIKKHFVNPELSKKDMESYGLEKLGPKDGLQFVRKKNYLDLISK